jgi:hypothetical protein
MEQKIFMYKNDGEKKQHKVYNVDASEAQSLIDDGKATPVSFGAYEDLRKQVQQAHQKYDKARQAIKSSDHPKYNIDGARDYYIKEAYTEFEAEAKRLQAEWQTERQAMQAEASRKAARAAVHIKESDRNVAEQVGGRLLASINGATNARDLAQAVTQASQDIGYLSDAEKTVLQSRVGDFQAAVKTKADQFEANVRKSVIINAINDIRHEDLLTRKVSEQLPASVDHEFRQSQVVKRGRRSNIKPM